MQLVVATRNPHKLREIRELLAAPGLALTDLAGCAPAPPEVEEDGSTFEANAVKKAVTVAAWTGAWALADDSGLEVDALRGAPGVRSARYAGEPVDCARNNRKLLEALRDADRRTARFRCVIALAAPDGTVRTVEGACEGTIARAPRGAEGFGYDPLFVPLGGEQTFAELDAGAKNRISHRAVALRRAAEAWGALLAGAGRGL